jgi:hypothetical protein
VRTKSQPNRLGLYDDVRQILDAAMISGGGEFELPSHGKAVHWRQRAYKFRKLYAQTLASDDSFSMSPYDKLSMPTVPEDSSTVIINVREVVGTFTPNREPYEPIDVPVPGDDLFDVARSIANKIKEGGL